jgi:hypothetical protein
MTREAEICAGKSLAQGATVDSLAQLKGRGQFRKADEERLRGALLAEGKTREQFGRLVKAYRRRGELKVILDDPTRGPQGARSRYTAAMGAVEAHEAESRRIGEERGRELLRLTAKLEPLRAEVERLEALEREFEELGRFIRGENGADV